MASDRVIAQTTAEGGDGPAIVVEGATKRFGATAALAGVSLRVEPGTFVSLLGPSGCGKTTLLRIIGGFEAQDAGRVLIHGRPVDGLPPNKRPVNTVFQRYALFPHKNVFENIAFPLVLRGVPKREQRQRVGEALDLVRLPGIEARTPGQLSGGQAQRVALARALIGRPAVLLLDEPLAALDLKLRKAMQLELRRIQEELGTSFLYVTHDQEEALTMSDRIVLMNEGRIVQEGAPAEIYERPASVFASGFIGEANLLPGTVTAADAGGTRVRVDGFDLVAPPAPLRPGQAVTVSVRPERLRVGRRDEVAGVENCLPGVLRRRIYLGHLVRRVVEVAPGLVLIAEAGAEPDSTPEGSPVAVAWPASASTVLPADGAGEAGRDGG